MGWIKRYGKWVWKGQTSAYRGTKRAGGYIRAGNQLIKRGITRPFRYADTFYTNRGGRYPYPKVRVGYGTRGGFTPYSGSRMERDGNWVHKKWNGVWRWFYNSPNRGGASPRRNWRNRSRERGY